MKFASLALAAVVLLGCTPVVNQRGYLPDPMGEASIKVGTDTKTTIQQRLGDPSTEAEFGGDSWYYVSSVEKQVAFFDPNIQTRAIMAVYFDKDGKVTDIKHYGLKDGHVIAFESRTTPTPGHELSFLEQLFGSTPGVPLGTAAAPGGQGQPTPGGGGGGYP
jgi:outer membrane protein assembly factor BamE (lipoprotein component of BamABCDE complex)